MRGFRAAIAALLASCRAAGTTSDGGEADPNVPLPWGPADCFVLPTFAAGEAVVFSDVHYGDAYNKYKLRHEKLLLDVYFPPDTDARQRRPVAVLMHGGSFVGGDKSEDSIPHLARLFTQRGYVAVSINYRLIPIPLVFLDYTATGPMMATEDARAAVRFLRSKAKEWRLDAGRIAMAGDSAGAMSALYYGFIGREEGSSGNPGYSSVINGVVSISGALKAQAFCLFLGKGGAPHGCLINSPPGVDYTNSLRPGGVPVMEIHGELDTVIPFVNGREVIAEANASGIRSELVTVPLGQHVPWLQVFDPALPYMWRMFYFMSGMLNLAQAECPRRLLDEERDDLQQISV